MTTGHVVVVGAGVFGATAALALVERGWRVTLVDAGPISRPEAASTDISKLVRMDYGRDAFYVGWMAHALDGWRAWNQSFPRPLYHEDGLLVLASSWLPGGFEHDSAVSLAAAGSNVERCDGPEVSARFPAWRWSGPAYWNPRAGWAESGAVVAALVDRCRAAGVTVLPERPAVVSVIGGRARVIGIEADEVLVAGGAWSPSLLPALADRLRPVAQPIFLFAPPEPERFASDRFPPWACDIARTGWYGFPADGRGFVKVANHGPGLLLAPDEPRVVAPDWEPRFRSFLAQCIPELASAPVVERRLCLYCDAFDGDFLIARSPGVAGLTVSTGGSGHAFKFAPLLGGWAADALEGKSAADVARFAWRESGAPRTEHARSS